MSDKYFLDTNIIVYSFDVQSLDKQRIAKDLVSNAIKGQGCISYQVIHHKHVNKPFVSFIQSIRL